MCLIEYGIFGEGKQCFLTSDWLNFETLPQKTVLYFIEF